MIHLEVILNMYALQGGGHDQPWRRATSPTIQSASLHTGRIRHNIQHNILYIACMMIHLDMYVIHCTYYDTFRGTQYT